MKSDNLKESSPNKIERTRKAFWWIFTASFISLTLFMILNAMIVATPDASSFSRLSLLLTGISLLMSVIALTGFFATTALAWCKARKDKLHSESDIEKKDLEIKKLEKEIEDS